MFDLFPLIAWIIMMGFCLHWLLNGIKMKIKYEITAALALIFYFTGSFIGQYFNKFYQNSITTIFGLLIIAVGFFIFISQLIIMKKFGQGKNWENTTIVIKKGWFKYMRHPMYFGCAIANIGVLIWIPSYFTIIFMIISFILCIFSSKWEEQVNLEKFGEEYEKYKEEVKFWGII
ncbi:MAG: methyltransferase family protein [Promethearchaeota archaeon]